MRVSTRAGTTSNAPPGSDERCVNGERSMSHDGSLVSGPISVTMKATSSTPHAKGANRGAAPGERGRDPDHHPDGGQRGQARPRPMAPNDGASGATDGPTSPTTAPSSAIRAVVSSTGRRHVRAEPAEPARRPWRARPRPGPTARPRRAAARVRCRRRRRPRRRSGSRWRRRRPRPCRRCRRASRAGRGWRGRRPGRRPSRAATPTTTPPRTIPTAQPTIVPRASRVTSGNGPVSIRPARAGPPRAGIRPAPRSRRSSRATATASPPTRVSTPRQQQPGAVGAVGLDPPGPAQRREPAERVGERPRVRRVGDRRAGRTSPRARRTPARRRRASSRRAAPRRPRRRPSRARPSATRRRRRCCR